MSLIEEAIKNKLHTNIKRYELLLRGSRDGFLSQNFHQKCDGKNNTISFILTKKGRRFGGFTEATWDQTGKWKKDPNSFVFSLDNKEIYYIKKMLIAFIVMELKNHIFWDLEKVMILNYIVNVMKIIVVMITQLLVLKQMERNML